MPNGLLDLIGSDLTPDSDRWTRGYDLDSRQCAATLSLIDADCLPEIGADLIGGPDSADHFPEPVRVGMASAIIARLTRPVSCARPDDADWLATAMASRAMRERLAGVLLINAVAASDAPEIAVIGSDVADAVRAARSLWVRSVAGSRPVLHVTGRAACALIRSGDLKRHKLTGEIISAFGDRVILSTGYELGDGTVLAFYTAETVTVRLDHAQVTTVNKARGNLVMQISEGLGSAGIVPCAVVKVIAA